MKILKIFRLPSPKQGMKDHVFSMPCRVEGGRMKVKIGELAKMTGCKVVTIRYYEKEGLLKSPDRTEGNYRLYGDDDITRLRFIRHCRQHGMNLSEIRDLLAFSDNPNVSCDWINTLIQKHIANVDMQINDLLHLKSHLETLYHKCNGGKKKECGILKSLIDGENCIYCQEMKCQKSCTTGKAGCIG